MNNSQYDAVKDLFSELLNSVSTEFSEGELGEIYEFIYIAEYGLALQTFIDIVIEEDKRINNYVVTICEDLAKLMKITDEVNLQAMRNATK